MKYHVFDMKFLPHRIQYTNYYRYDECSFCRQWTFTFVNSFGPVCVNHLKTILDEDAIRKVTAAIDGKL